MTETSERFLRVAEGFSARVEAVPEEAWEKPSPCEEWTARDVVAHVIDALGRFVGRAGVELPAGPSPDDDPVGAWEAARGAVQAALEDPSIAGREYETRMGPTTLESSIGRFGIGDVLLHTWDVARAVGLDDHLDPDEVHRLFLVMEPNDALMRQGTAFGPRIEVPDDSDEQTRLLAFTGRPV